jgi:hypothetical protein
MKIIGCDFHPSFQQIAMLDLETGEYTKKKLRHATGEAVEFYRGLTGEVRVGFEVTIRIDACASTPPRGLSLGSFTSCICAPVTSLIP